MAKDACVSKVTFGVQVVATTKHQPPTSNYESKGLNGVPVEDVEDGGTHSDRLGCAHEQTQVHHVARGAVGLEHHFIILVDCGLPL